VPASRPASSRLAALLGAAAIAVLAGACSGNPASPPDGTTAPTTAVPATAAPGTTATNPGTTTPVYPAPPARPGPGAPPSTASPAGKLVVRAGGIADFDFGTPTGPTLGYLEKLLGPAERSEGAREVCPGYTFAAWKTPGITAVFDPDGNFAGWDVHKAGGAATPEGAAVGSDLATVRRLYGAGFTLDETTLGHEFSVAEQPRGERSFSGLVNRTTDDGTVTSLWSGFVCAAR
jgi:hypothetical protein